MQCNYTEGGQRDCSEHMDKIVPCDIYAPTGKIYSILNNFSFSEKK